MDGFIAAVIAVLVVVGILVGIGVNGEYTHYVNGINYNAKIGGYFDLADRASTPEQKLVYLEKYKEAIETEGLNKGVNSVYNTNMPAAQNSETFNTLQSLIDRTEALTHQDKNAVSYYYNLQSLTWTEFCWFPDNAFEQAYQLQHGGWGDALFPPGAYNHCSSSSSKTSSMPVPTS